MATKRKPVYVISNRLKPRLLGADYYNALQQLFGGDALYVIANATDGANSTSCALVLRYITDRTIRFHKIVERLSAQEIKNGIGIIGLRTIQRALKALVTSGFVIKVAWGCKLVFYGLDIPAVLRQLRKVWGEKLRIPNLKIKKALQLISLVTEPTLSLENEFFARLRNTTTKSMEELMHELSTEKIIGGDYDAPKKESEIEKQSRKKRERQHDARKYRSSGKDWLRLWYDCVKAEEEAEYAPYLLENTGRAKGMMKNWVDSLKASGFDVEDIEQRIRQIIERWRHYAGTKFEIKYGKKISFPKIPSFDNYFTYREHIDAYMGIGASSAVDSEERKQPADMSKFL